MNGSGNADQGKLASLTEIAQLVRCWRNHWAEVERITADFPEDIKRVLALRPTDAREALEQTVAQFAVLFNPQATAEFVDRLRDVLRTIESLIEARDADRSA